MSALQTFQKTTANSSLGWLHDQIRKELATCERGREDLRTYQSDRLIPFVMDTPKCLAAVDMGLGKTVSVLTVLDALFCSNASKKALIVAPKRVAIQTWPGELSLWRHLKWLRYSLIRPNPDDPDVIAVGRWAARNDPLSASNARSKALTAEYEIQKAVAAMDDAPIHIINREQVVWLVDFFGRKWPYDVLVVDESTSFADHTSARFQALAKVAQRTPRVVLLSGTPAPEGIGDLFAQAYLLDGGARFGKGITAFRERYMMLHTGMAMHGVRKWIPQKGGVEAVTRKLADICLVMKEADYLPPRTKLEIIRPIVLDRKELARYKEFEKSLVLDFPDESGFIEAVNAGVLHGKLLQLCSGAVYDKDRKVHFYHDHKIEELQELREELGDEPAMIAYWFKPSLARLQKAFPKATTMDKDGKCVDAWNAGKIRDLFVHPQSAGHGLNMQKGPGRTLIFYDTPESLELYKQIIGRIDRQGQTRTVKIYYLAVQDTIEAGAVKKLYNKESNQEFISAHLRRLRAQFIKTKKVTFPKELDYGL